MMMFMMKLKRVNDSMVVIDGVVRAGITLYKWNDYIVQMTPHTYQRTSRNNIEKNGTQEIHFSECVQHS